VQSLARSIIEATERAAAVTRRLLTFSRRGDLRAEPVGADSLLAGMREILSHTLGTGIAVRVKTEAGLPPLFVDKAQLETVLVNVATNARDAMQGMGTLTFDAAMDVVRDGKAASRRVTLKAGAYVRLGVTDTGSGMMPEVLARASEPFFTTKEMGKGTGLGLSMARGFAEQSHGGLLIESAVGRGTTVTLWFPLAEERLLSAGARDGEAHSAAPGVARARLLLVDDDRIVREMLTLGMEAEGYAVLSAASGAEALSLLDAGEAVDLVISDLSMPRMDGVSVIRGVQRRRPHLPAILLTGFVKTSAGIDLDAGLSGPFTVLRKPVHETTLAEHVAMLLEGRGDARPSRSR
ncbi:MAG: response regulator, partial [Acetobacteraceae bacterium]